MELNKGKKKSLVGYTYSDWSWKIDQDYGVVINRMGINIVTPRRRNENEFNKNHYSKKVRITIEEL